MRQDIGRRAFVGSVMASVPLLADTAFALPQSDGPVAHVHTPDAVSQELLEQFRIAARALRQSGKAEYARAIASVLRIEAAHGVATGLDNLWKKGLDERLRTQGLGAVINQEIDATRWRREAAAFGAPQLQAPFVSTADRQKGLNAILTAGVTATLLNAAKEFELRAPALAKGTGYGPLRPVQYDCDSYMRALALVQWEMAIACGMSFLDGGVACDFLLGTYVGLQAMAWWYGC